MRAKEVRALIAGSLREGAELHSRLFHACAEGVVRAAITVKSSLQRGGKVLLFGNGGSAADAQHIAAELVGRFVPDRDRDPFPAIALTTDTSILTAVSNDYGFDQVFARQVRALSRPADVVIAISTSGRSPNVLAAVKAARTLGLKTIGLTGGDGGRLVRLVDIALVVPSTNTARIQECHIALGHVLCETAEALLLAKRKVPRRGTRGAMA